ncbi:hypothetical protein [Escherichia coli]|uniref:hypothetical protein n=1 Tax=Escherichia coli TaxID=562 RepID=UPI000D6F488F|nr:hypothetical protein [Escherichia coli]
MDIVGRATDEGRFAFCSLNYNIPYVKIILAVSTFISLSITSAFGAPIRYEHNMELSSLPSYNVQISSAELCARLGTDECTTDFTVREAGGNKGVYIRLNNKVTIGENVMMQPAQCTSNGSVISVDNAFWVNQLELGGKEYNVKKAPHIVTPGTGRISLLANAYTDSVGAISGKNVNQCRIPLVHTLDQTPIGEVVFTGVIQTYVPPAITLDEDNIAVHASASGDWVVTTPVKITTGPARMTIRSTEDIQIGLGNPWSPMGNEFLTDFRDERGGVYTSILKVKGRLRNNNVHQQVSINFILETT